MIHLHSWDTSNGRKVFVLLEELGLPYTYHVPYGLKRYGDEIRHLLGVLDRRLADVDYLGVDYSIADIAVFPWVVRTEWMDLDLGAFPNVKRWYDAIAARPAVQRVLAGNAGQLRPLLLVASAVDHRPNRPTSAQGLP